MTTLELLEKKVNYPEPEDWPVPVPKKDLQALLNIAKEAEWLASPEAEFKQYYTSTAASFSRNLRTLHDSGKDRTL